MFRLNGCRLWLPACLAIFALCGMETARAIECELIDKLDVTCRPGGKKAFVHATLSSRLEQGVKVTLLLDGERPRIRTISRTGVVNAEWRVKPGQAYEVCLEGCPDVCRKVRCPS